MTVVARLRSRFDVVAREAAKFGTVGAISYVVDLVVFNLVLHLLDDKPITAKIVSTVVSATNAFLLNRHWSFRHRERQSVRRESGLFVVLNLIGLGIALLCLAVSHYVLGFDGKLADNIAANGIGLVLGTAFRFWSYRRFVWTQATSVETAAYDGDTAAAVALDTAADHGSEQGGAPQHSRAQDEPVLDAAER